ncbi:translation initiation factor IF-2 [Candidatus Pacearchaeota archaeon ex4484_26]|nr:MAG: translation initiation factor IF-2 [Candidatus Pacearchaeota archaeon ex4484_26]
MSQKQRTSIRQPIVTVAGHVDHGKTSILDSIRGTSIAKKEAGAITQIISCTILPAEQIKKLTAKLMEKFKIKLTIPGFLFIDTPGHAAFTNLRKRGGSLADIVILVIDIREGIMEQTIECINILKENKIPFVVALNKIDAIPGWQQKEKELSANIKVQTGYTKKEFDKNFYSVVAKLNDHGFDSELFERITDFTKQVPLVPVSAKTGEGISELLVMLAGLSQKFLEKKLILKEKRAKGTILEVKKEKTITFLEAVIYDGIIKQNSTIIIGSFDEPIKTKVRALFEALPLAKGFKSVKEARAATFIRLQVPSQEIFPGMPLISAETEQGIDEAKKEVKQEVKETIRLDKEGIVIKADSLGSLEALLFQLRKQGTKVSKAGVGDIKKSDVLHASSMKKIEQVVLGFNVGISEDVDTKIKVITSPIIYKILEQFAEWQDKIEKELLREKLAVTMPCKIKVLPYIFRKNKPAVFGVRVEAGKLKAGLKLMNKDGRKIDEIKTIQSENKTIHEAEKGKEVAISLPNITIGRQVKKGDTLYSVLNESEFKKLENNRKYLNSDELATLQEILEIMRRKNPLWGI